MNAEVLAFSARGYAIGERLLPHLRENGTAALTRCESGMLDDWTQRHFNNNDALIFIGACGIAVRAVAPYLKSKTSDPAVLVIDECGQYVIPVLSGHIGGANALAVRIAKKLDALPILTTATDVNGVFAVDTWATEQGLRIANPERIKWISSRLLAGETIGIQRSKWATVGGELPPGLALTEKDGDVRITHRTRGRKDALLLVPPNVTLGIGARKNVSEEAVEQAYNLLLAKANCHPLAVARVCSVDLKANEPAILAFCARHKLPYVTYSAAELAAVPGRFSASAFVRKTIGVDNVCERSAVLGSGENGKLLVGKDAGNGVTMALAIAPCNLTFDVKEEEMQ